MTLGQYLKNNAILMMSVDIDNNTFQYNYWNIMDNQLYLLNDNFTIGHILFLDSEINDSTDGSFTVSSKLFPKFYILNMYFGGLR